jgi:hypothetical protein
VTAIRIAKIPAVLLAFGLLLAGCSSTSNASIPAPTIQGPSGHQFSLSYFNEQSSKSWFNENLAPTKIGPEVEMFSRYARGNVDAFVYELSETVPRSRVTPVIRNFLPTSQGARMISWRGFPAATDSVPCSHQAASCSGVVNVLVVLKGSTIYEVMVNAPTNALSQAVFNSFRFIK